MHEKVIQNYALYQVGWVAKPNVSDGLWACWVFNPSYPLCHFFLHFTIVRLGEPTQLDYFEIGNHSTGIRLLRC